MHVCQQQFLFAQTAMILISHGAGRPCPDRLKYRTQCRCCRTLALSLHNAVVPVYLWAPVMLSGRQIPPSLPPLPMRRLFYHCQHHPGPGASSGYHAPCLKKYHLMHASGRPSLKKADMYKIYPLNHIFWGALYADFAHWYDYGD